MNPVVDLGRKRILSYAVVVNGSHPADLSGTAKAFSKEKVFLEEPLG